MRFISLAFVASFSAIAIAQAPNLQELPNCARTCVGTSFGGCGNLDVRCICSNTKLISDLSCCVSTACSAADQQKTINFAVQLCQAYGISVPTVASCAAGASSTGAAAATGSSSEAASITSSGSASATSVASASASSAISSAASQASSAAAATTTTNAASHNNMGSGVGLGIAVAGMLAAL